MSACRERQWIGRTAADMLSRIGKACARARRAGGRDQVTAGQGRAGEPRQAGFHPGHGGARGDPRCGMGTPDLATLLDMILSDASQRGECSHITQQEFRVLDAIVREVGSAALNGGPTAPDGERFTPSQGH